MLFRSLLRANAVNYAVRGQDASGLGFGAKHHRHPPRIDEDVTRLLSKGVPVRVVATARGLRWYAGLLNLHDPIQRDELDRVLLAHANRSR